VHDDIVGYHVKSESAKVNGTVPTGGVTAQQLNGFVPSAHCAVDQMMSTLTKTLTTQLAY